MNKYLYRLGFIGSGNMAIAIAEGAVKSGFITKENVLMSNTTGITKVSGIKTVTDNNYILDNCEYVVLAVKPQVFKQIANNLNNTKCKAIISVMAAITSNYLKEVFRNAEIFRIMPNTPSKIGLGMSVIANNINSKESNLFVEKIFNSMGKTIYINENLFDSVTSVSGSGPAYVYMFIKAMIDGGIDGGLSLEQSKFLALQTVIGATEMASQSNNLDLLISNVCSKGGTTIEAVNSLKADDLNNIVRKAMSACKKRSEELGKN